MKTYKFTTTVTVSAYTLVSAESLEQAKAEAASRSLMTAPANLGNGADDWSEWVVKEFDGEPGEPALEDMEDEE